MSGYAGKTQGCSRASYFQAEQRKAARLRTDFQNRSVSGRAGVSVRALLAVTLTLSAVGAATLDQQKPSGNSSREKENGPRQASAPVAKGKKLILKDGSFQIAREYQRKGDRVRYYSIERSEWEEIPADLVDWEATRKAETEDARRQQELVEKIKATEATERAMEIDVDASIAIAPGVFLPSGEGLYAAQGTELIPLEQASADIKLDKKRLLTQVISPIPIIPSRHKVQIPGKRASVRLATAQPEFYMRTADGREPRIELIHAQVKGDARLLEFISTQITGQQTAKRDTISLQSWKVAKGVYRFTLGQSLAPGEYAVGEILPEGLNLYVWDFGVDPPGTPKPPPAKKAASPAPQKH